MQNQTFAALLIAHEMRRRDIDDAVRARSLRRAAVPSQPLRRAIGRSIIRIGERVAAEPSFQPARSR